MNAANEREAMSNSSSPRGRRDAEQPAAMLRGLAFSHAGRHDEALSILEQARKRARAARHVDLEAEILSMMSRQSFLAYDTSQALELANSILELSTQQNTKLRAPLLFRGHLSLAQTRGHLGHVAESRAALMRAEDSCTITDAPELCDYLEARAMGEAKIGSAGSSMAAFKQVLEISFRCDSIEKYACRLTSAASCAAIAGFIDLAFQFYECALAHTAPLPVDSRLPPGVLTEYAWTALSVGEFATAARLLARVSDSSSLCARVQGVATGLILATLGFGEPSTLKQPELGVLTLACKGGIAQRIGPIAAAVHARYISLGQSDAAAEVLSRSVNSLTSVDGSWWLLLAVATHGSREDIHKALALLALFGDGLKLAHAHRLLLEARLAKDDGSDESSEGIAWQAAQLFNDLGWRYHRAIALRFAGRHAMARDLLLRMGVCPKLAGVGGTRRNHRRPTHHWGLSEVDDEIIRLVFQNSTARAIGASVGMSERAVKYHLTDIFATFGVSNRRELAAILYERVRDRISPEGFLSKL